MNKVVVITGGNSGIGRETALLLEKQGYTVVILSLNVSEADGKHCFECDVRDERAVEEAFAKIKAQFGSVYAVVNSAGYGVSGASELIGSDKTRDIFETNVQGVINVSKYALPLMGKNSKLINLSSAMAFFPLPFRTMYAATKSAVLTLSYGMRMELSDCGVWVTAICPGDVKTNFTKNRIKLFETNERYGKRIENAASGLDGKEDKRMSPVIVAKVIVKELKKRKSKHLKIVGFKYKVLYIIQKIVPMSWVLGVIDKAYGGYK